MIHKVKSISDLHMEGQRFKYDHSGETVIFLPGDIHTQNRHMELLEQVPKDVQIIFVPGNHEYYSNSFESVNLYLRQLELQLSNFKYLDNEAFTGIEGLDIYGGTMFTDFKLKGDPWKSQMDAQSGISDFLHIRYYDETEHRIRTWSTLQHLAEFRRFEAGLISWLDSEPQGTRIVISHFMPSLQVSDEAFRGSNLNPYFVCDMERYMPHIDYWFCGHGHTAFRVNIGGCEVIINPRGYGYEKGYSGFNSNLVVEIPTKGEVNNDLFNGGVSTQ